MDPLAVSRYYVYVLTYMEFTLDYKLIIYLNMIENFNQYKYFNNSIKRFANNYYFKSLLIVIVEDMCIYVPPYQ